MSREKDAGAAFLKGFCPFTACIEHLRKRSTGGGKGTEKECAYNS